MMTAQSSCLLLSAAYLSRLLSTMVATCRSHLYRDGVLLDVDLKSGLSLKLFNNAADARAGVGLSPSYAGENTGALTPASCSLFHQHGGYRYHSAAAITFITRKTLC